jgi:hypothetical protein
MTDDPTLLTPETAAPTEVLAQQVTSADYVVLRMAVLGLILTVLLCISAVSFAAMSDKALPDGVLAIGSAGVGALATMLVRPPNEAPRRFRTGDRIGTL